MPERARHGWAARSSTGASGWIGELPYSPLGAFDSGTVGTNEVVLEIEGELAQATIVFEMLGVPVFTEAGEVLCSADVLFTIEFPTVPVADPAAFELLGTMTATEGGRAGSDCSRASPAEPIEAPATALFTASGESQVLASLELFVGGERVYEQPIELISG